MPQLLVLVRVGGPQLKYDYFGGRGLKRLRTASLGEYTGQVIYTLYSDHGNQTTRMNALKYVSKHV